MADEKHDEILRSGVEVWNKWREKNQDLEIDLSGADLSGVDLSGANLSGANLYGADLSDADLSDANLYGANLYGANLYGANLSGAFLYGANLSGAFLKGANLSGANLYGAFLSGANLYGANLYGAFLSGANLYGANFEGANFEGANLYGANLYRAFLYRANLKGANLKGAFLKGANFYGANLYGANLSGAYLKDADFYGANLDKVQALVSNFEGAILTGSCIEDWNINSQTNLHDVKCDYIYLKYIYSEEEKKWIYNDRIPHDTNKIFAPGEFTKRYQKILETVNLYFCDGIDWQVFLNSFQKLQKEEKLKVEDGDRQLPIVQGIENTGDGSFVIKVGVSPDTDKEEYEKSFWQKYQPMLEAAEEKYRLLLDVKQEQINDFRQQNTHLMKVIELQASQQTVIYNNLNNQQEQKNVNQQKLNNY